MIKRYAKLVIDEIWSGKFELWQKTELAVIEAKARLGIIIKTKARVAGFKIFYRISEIMRANQIDTMEIDRLEKILKHDMNSFLKERSKFLEPEKLDGYLHERITSYDTEEAAFVNMLRGSVAEVEKNLETVFTALKTLAVKYRYTIMNGRTHGQEAELQSFGKRVLTWYKQLTIDWELLRHAAKYMKFSKLSGAIGNYGGIDPKIEKEALKILQLEPFYGSTQIMPRELYAPLAHALCQIVLTLNKIAIDIRLGARSGRPIYQEPFGEVQMGSSAMPHKKNTISTEQIKGMARLATAYFGAILDNIETWEERAIEQSSVERVAWPDLFHVVLHSLEVMQKVLSGLKVYPDNMLKEVVESCGCYASGEAKEFIKEKGADSGITKEDAYRIVQLAAFNTFESNSEANTFRDKIAGNLVRADSLLSAYEHVLQSRRRSIQSIISDGELKPSPSLSGSAGAVDRWNEKLKEIFSNSQSIIEWNMIFMPSYLLQNEKHLYEKILGI